MTKRTILLIGGARSGKSNYAEALARETGDDVLFVATAEAGDDEMKRRIEVHKKARPAHWHTLETSCGVGGCIAEDKRIYDVVVLDCITPLTTNVLCKHMAVDGDDVSETAVENDVKVKINSIIEAMRQSSATYIIVSNEVGEGIIPLGASTRIYRDVLGRANQMLANACDEVYLMVAGIPLRIKPQ
ncbi:MAG: bifunctional adenosylcobinamide kinase/adenosylcobinamide-phosphate guanylyltransferase [Dehalococcoidia bacterium]|nr:MAG: bifunctional adenosylcobinamide kinase/adenosylcobinamide-phosphate guanylyltransferase [Dehalococcoidia bacterium]